MAPPAREHGRRAGRLGAAAALLWLAAPGCSKKAGEAPMGEPVLVPFSCAELQAAPGAHTVLVEDSGFDLRDPVFEGKIGGCYSIACDPSPPPPAGGFEAERTALLAELAQKDARCRIVAGLSLRESSSFASIADARGDWNAGTLGDAAERRAVEQVLGGEGKYIYHGTATAGVVAHDNPATRIVFLHDPQIVASAASEPCATADEAAMQIKLLSDPAVRDAYVHQPPSLLDDDYEALLARHRVTLVNRSFGPETLRGIKARCPGPDWDTLYKLTGDLSAERELLARALAPRPASAPLFVQAAGNEGEAIDTRAAWASCAVGDAVTSGAPLGDDLIVGSYGAPGGAPRTSAFSNTGACVDLYAPGEFVRCPLPEGFFAALAGTSFSAPLTVRLATLTLPSGLGHAATRAALLAKVDGRSFLPLAGFPPELLVDPNSLTRSRPVAPTRASRRGPGLRP